VDSENHIYLVDAFRGSVQVFDREGELLYEFGGRGTQLGQFQLPAGLFVDRDDRVYVVDSYNHRVQVFQYHGLKTSVLGARP
jgi:DNA-binding beta-propeller fold protein YncE